MVCSLCDAIWCVHFVMLYGVCTLLFYMVCSFCNAKGYAHFVMLKGVLTL